MRRSQKSTPLAAIGRPLIRMAPLVLVAMLAGCVPEPAFDNDPLLGGRPLPRNNGLGTPPGGIAAGPKAPAAPFAPIAATGAASPASLAAGSPPTDASPLRIGQPPVNPSSPGALAAAPRDTGEAWHGTATAAGATLKQPLLVAEPAVRPIAMIAPPAPSAAPATATTAPGQYEALQDLLARRGVLFQSLEGPDEHGVWRFSCGVPTRDQQGGVHRIEVSVPGDHGLASVRAALDQIDQYQR